MAGARDAGSLRAMPGRLGQLDRAAIIAVGNGRRPGLVAAARAVSALAEPAVCTALLAACAVRAGRRSGWRDALVPGAAVVTGAAARRRLSRLIARPRPPAEIWLIEPEGFSFPSKHTTLAALTAGACARSLGAGRAAEHAAVALTAAAVGTSRVYLGVHWPTDIAAGWLFAEGWLRLPGAAQAARSRPRPGQPAC